MEYSRIKEKNIIERKGTTRKGIWTIKSNNGGKIKPRFSFEKQQKNK